MKDDKIDSKIVRRTLPASMPLEYKTDHVSTLSSAFKRIFSVLPADVQLPEFVADDDGAAAWAGRASVMSRTPDAFNGLPCGRSNDGAGFNMFTPRQKLL